MLLLLSCLVLLLWNALAAISSASQWPGKRAHGFKVPVHRVPRPPRGSEHILSTDVSVVNSHEFAYLVHVNIGGQDFEVTFDTGSSDLWVVSTDCNSDDCEGVSKYVESDSSSVNMSSTPFQLSYLLGSVLGNVASENITIGPFEISSQIIALANKTTGLGLSGTGNSGIVGLAFPSVASIAATSGTTLLENLFSQFEESQRYFAFRLGRELGQGANATGSSFTVGQLDPAVTNDTSRFAYMNVSRVGADDFNYWKVPLHGLTINSVPFSISPSLVPDARTPIAVLDTGTTLVLGPTSDVEAFWATVGESRKNPDTGSWEVRCERGVVVGFVLGTSGDEREYAVDPADISWAEGGNSSGWCMGGVQANDEVNSGDWILGDIFLRNVYVSHHSATSKNPPTIGLLNMTDPISALSAFRTDRGSDLSPLPSNRGGATARNGGRPNVMFVCSLSTAGGFVGGAAFTLLVLIKRRRNQGSRKGNISL